MCDYSLNEVTTRGVKKAPDVKTGIYLEHKSHLRLKRWLIGLLVFLFVSLVVINTYTTDQLRAVRYTAVFNESLQEKLDNSGFLVRNKGCRIPAMDPYDPAIKRFIHKEEPIVCEHGDHLPLIESNDSALYVNPAAIGHFYNNSEEVDCCWRPFWRTKDEDNAVTYDSDCFKFRASSSVNAEFVKVECFRGGELIYKDYHAFVPRRNIRTSNEDSLSLLIVGIDSVSRINFHRMMPKSAQALRELGAVEMLGYTKVADNTYPNLVPVLTGLSEGELRERCWQTKDKPFDECPFIWKDFRAAGYRTVFAEDACSMTTFNYLKPGFREPPTDYYLRPFCIASEKDIGNTHKLNANLCVGTRKTFDNLLQYAKKTATRFYKDPYFALIWQSSLTHDFFTYPQLGDQSYYDLITHLSNQRLLNRTALVVMSDHGMRWGSFRETYQGRMEDSLPFVFLVLPEWWKERHQVAWANLRRNARSLTTAFDLHETLLDLLHPEKLEESRMKSHLSREDDLPRGISWFLPIPGYRTCNMAGIASHWCMCHDSKDTSLKEPGLKEKASFLVSELNRMLKRFAQCARLKLKEVKSAKEWRAEGNGSELVDYTITVQTEPGGAIFEGTVRHRGGDKSNTLVGSVGRLNAYGKQSACVDEFNMRLYCYCL